jgi:hypothetical protein
MQPTGYIHTRDSYRSKVHYTTANASTQKKMNDGKQAIQDL